MLREEAWVEDVVAGVEVVICLLFHRQCGYRKDLIKVNEY